MTSCSCIHLTVQSNVILETWAMQSSANFSVFMFLYYPATPYMAAISYGDQVNIDVS